MEPTGARTFRAFISYSHADEVICARLHKRLDGYRVPKTLIDAPGLHGELPRTLYPVFRDREELAASADLPQRLLDAIERSESLVVICSPDAARSRWVGEEIRQFAERHGTERIHPVIVRGDPPGCFPPELLNLVDEPLAADLREDKDGVVDGSLKLIAGILGIPFARLKDREAARERRRTRITYALATTFAVLAIVAAVAAIVATEQLGKAQEAIRIAVKGVTGVQEQVAEHRQSGKIATDVAANLLRDAAELAEDVERLAPGNDDLGMEFARNRIMVARTARRLGDLSTSIEAAEQALIAGDKLEASDRYHWDGVRYAASAHNELGDTLLRQGRLDSALQHYRTALDGARRLLTAAPDQPHRIREVGVSLDKLGDALRLAGEREGAHAAFEESLALARRFAKAAPTNRNARRDVALGLSKLADLAMEVGRDDEALARYDETRDILEQLVELEPDNKQWLRDLSAALNDIGELRLQRLETAAASDAFTRSIEIRRRLVARDPADLSLRQDLSLSLQKLGDAHYRAGDYTAAEPYFVESLAIDRDLVERDPGNRDWRSALTASLDRLGDLTRTRGDLEQAAAYYAESLAATRLLYETAPDNVDWHRGLYIGYDRSADIKQARDDLDAAAADRTKAVKLVRELLRKDPEHAIWLGDLANMLSTLGDLEQARGNIKPASAAHRESLEVARRLVAQAPDDTSRLHQLSIGLGRAAWHLRESGDMQGALRLYRESLDLSRRLKKTYPDPVKADENLAIDLAHVAKLELALSRRDNAIRHYRERLDALLRLADAKPGYLADVVVAYGELSNLYVEQKDLDAARAMQHGRLEAAHAGPDDAIWRQSRLVWLDELRDFEQQLGNADEAISAQHQKTELVRRLAQENPAWRVDLAIGLQLLAQLKFDTGDRAGAATVLSQKLTVARELATDGAAQWQHDVAVTLVALADLGTGDLSASLTEAIALLRDLDARGELDEKSNNFLVVIEQRVDELGRQR